MPEKYASFLIIYIFPIIIYGKLCRLALLTQEAEHFRLPQLRDQAIALLHKCTSEENGTAEACGYVSEVGWTRGDGMASNSTRNARNQKKINGHNNTNKNIVEDDNNENEDDEEEEEENGICS
jgi:hypothetical protein